MIRGNASRLSHAELDDAIELDDGDPAEFGDQCVNIRRRFPHVNVLGGCCGTDARHIEAIASLLSRPGGEVFDRFSSSQYLPTSELCADGFDLCVRLERLVTHLTTPAGLLVPAEG